MVLIALLLELLFCGFVIVCWCLLVLCFGVDDCCLLIWIVLLLVDFCVDDWLSYCFGLCSLDFDTFGLFGVLWVGITGV